MDRDVRSAQDALRRRLALAEADLDVLERRRRLIGNPIYHTDERYAEWRTKYEAALEERDAVRAALEPDLTPQEIDYPRPRSSGPTSPFRPGRPPASPPAVEVAPERFAAARVRPTPPDDEAARSIVALSGQALQDAQEDITRAVTAERKATSIRQPSAAAIARRLKWKPDSFRKYLREHPEVIPPELGWFPRRTAGPR